MANIFNLSNDQTPDVNRNTFDLSFQNNLTLKMGTLYPVFCKEVLPGDTFKIRPTFAIEAMPMVFPVQTRLRSNLHFFYCRNRAAYKEFEDWITNNDPDADPPYLDLAANFDNIAKTGSLGDYLGLPTVRYGDYMDSFNLGVKVTSTGISTTTFAFVICSPDGGDTNALELNSVVTESPSPQDLAKLAFGSSAFFAIGLDASAALDSLGTSIRLRDIHLPDSLTFYFDSIDLPASLSANVSLVGLDSGDNVVSFHDMASSSFNRGMDSQGRAYYNVPIDFDPEMSIDMELEPGLASFALFVCFDGVKPDNMRLMSNSFLGNSAPFSVSMKVSKQVDPLDYEDLTAATSPYYDSLKNPEGIKINALPFRHYEAVYNTFYRDSRNNPLMVNGKPEYNKVYLTTDGGPDKTYYKLRNRNWESDFLTTAVQSPQQGAAPLVGITSTGKMTFQDEAGKQYQAQAEFAEDGETITGFRVLSDDMPQGNLRSLVDMASTGVSIADLRQVNSLQRWLEANMRKGLRYRDQMKAHFGIDIAYKELNMPEFIGGVSEDVRVNMVTQTTPTEGDGTPDNPARPLGSYAGQASCVGTSNHEVDQYCDEHGYIIGIFSITPVPNYSQLLPKHFIKRNIMDYFYPEFGNLGFVPIKYDEVCPIEVKSMGDRFNDVFGYQRAWYDYLASVDEVHGEFRKSLRDYLINRVFRSKPELGEDFLTVDPRTVNEVFAVTTASDDKFLGQIYFDCKVKRPIPLYGIPRLE